MKPIPLICLFSVMGSLSLLAEEENGGLFEQLDKQSRGGLMKGETVILPHRPDKELKKEPDPRFVTVARLVHGDRETIWEVINDKEDAEHFLDGVMESRVLEQSEAHIVVEQRTHVGGPKGDYLYKIRHDLTPMQRADFSYIEGEIRNIVGSWWIADCPKPEHHLLIYSLHIDPGFYAPQFIVKRGMKKTMPKTIQSIEREVRRRMEE